VRVVSTLGRSREDGTIFTATLSSSSVVAAIDRALDGADPADPIEHPLVREAEEPLAAFIGAVEGRA